MAFVLDCSVAISWYFKDEINEDALSLRDRLLEEPLIVPMLWSMEICNVVSVAIRRERITSNEAPQLLADLRELPDSVDNETEAMVWNHAFDLAQQYNLSVYDSVYLELAIRKKLPLATLDKGLRKACEQAGVAVLP